MAKYSNLAEFLTAIADEIRAKKGTTEAIVAEDFPSEIANINSCSYADAEGVSF